MFRVPGAGYQRDLPDAGQDSLDKAARVELPQAQSLLASICDYPRNIYILD
jgi:hypothetical protein